MANQTLLALDVGERRIGVAVAHSGVSLAHPLTTIDRADDAVAAIQVLLSENQADTLIVGLPRGLDGQETAQTKAVRQFVQQLEPRLTQPIRWQDEALTSRKAEVELETRGKPYTKSDVDALAATFILEDYLNEHR